MRNIIIAALILFGIFFYAIFLVRHEASRLRENPQTPEIFTYASSEVFDAELSSGLLVVPTVFSSEELVEMISAAPHYSQTRQFHPPRKMYPTELAAWIRIYNELGGINAQEFELYKIINEVRAEYGLPPFILCPRLSMASRLFSYFQVKYHTVGHIDPYYDDLMARSNLFGVFGSLYMENANSQQWYVMRDGSVEYVYLCPQGLVDGWMNSPPHREHILTTETIYAGFGVDSGRNRVVPTMKTIMPRQ